MATGQPNDSTKTNKQGLNARMKRMLKAFEAHYPNVSAASKAANVDRTMHYNWLKECPAYKERFDRFKDDLYDKAEGIVKKSIDDGDPEMAKWLLTKSKAGRERGYGDNVEVSGEGGGPIEIVFKETLVTRKEA